MMGIKFIIVSLLSFLCIQTSSQSLGTIPTASVVSGDDSTLIVTWEPPVGQYDGSISRYTLTTTPEWWWEAASAPDSVTTLVGFSRMPYAYSTYFNIYTGRCGANSFYNSRACTASNNAQAYAVFGNCMACNNGGYTTFSSIYLPSGLPVAVFRIPMVSMLPVTGTNTWSPATWVPTTDCNLIGGNCASGRTTTFNNPMTSTLLAAGANRSEYYSETGSIQNNLNSAFWNGVPYMELKGYGTSFYLSSTSETVIRTRVTRFSAASGRTVQAGIIIYDPDTDPTGPPRVVVKLMAVSVMGTTTCSINVRALYVYCSSATSCQWNTIGTAQTLPAQTSSMYIFSPAEYACNPDVTLLVSRNPIAGTWAFGALSTAGAQYSLGSITDATLLAGTNLWSTTAYTRNLATLRVAVVGEGIYNYAVGTSTYQEVGFSQFDVVSKSDFNKVYPGPSNYAGSGIVCTGGTHCVASQYGTCAAPSTVSRTYATSGICGYESLSNSSKYICRASIAGLINGWTYAVSLVGTDGTSFTNTVNVGNIKPILRLPVTGAQYIYDPNSLPSYVGSTGNGLILPVWPDASGNGFTLSSFSGFLDPMTTPRITPRSTNGVDTAIVTFCPGATNACNENSYFQLDKSLPNVNSLDSQLGIKSDYSNMEHTLFVLYRPAGDTGGVTTLNRMIASHGGNAATNEPGWQMYSVQGVYDNPGPTATTCSQTMGYRVGVTDSNTNTNIGLAVGMQFTSRNRLLTDIVTHPHNARVNLLTYHIFRNGTQGNAFASAGCVGVQTGTITADDCSYIPIAGSVAPVALGGFGGGTATKLWRDGKVGASYTNSSTPWTTMWTHSQGFPIANYNFTGMPTPWVGTGPGPFTLGAGTALGGSKIDRFYKGEMYAYIKFNRSLTLAERQKMQYYLFTRSGEYCPPIPQTRGVSFACPLTASGTNCPATGTTFLTCTGATPGGIKYDKIAGAPNVALRCYSGTWSFKGVTCAPSCPARPSPRYYATCRRDVLFDVWNNFTIGTYSANLPPDFDTLPVLPLLDSNRLWSIQQHSYRNYSKVLQFSLAHCTAPRATAEYPYVFYHNNPKWATDLKPGDRIMVTATITLQIANSRAGIALRYQSGAYPAACFGFGGARPTRYYALMFFAGIGVPTLQYYDSCRNGISAMAGATVMGNCPTSYAIGTPYFIEATVQRASPGSTAQSILVKINGTLCYSYTHTGTTQQPPLQSGSVGLVADGVSTASPALVHFHDWTISTDCANNGAVCQMYAGHRCTWTCGIGSVSTQPDNFYEYCSADGQLPTGANSTIACRPAPPIFKDQSFTMPENAMVDAIAQPNDGKLVAETVAAGQVPLFYILDTMGNNETLVDIYSRTCFPKNNNIGNDNSIAPGCVPLSYVSDVFRVGACDGVIYLNKPNVLSFDFGRRTYYMVVQACTDGDPNACTIAKAYINITNSPSKPFFRYDYISGLANPYTRYVAENSPVGTVVYLPVDAYSPDKNPLSYSIVYGNDRNAFRIAADGTLVVDNAILNFEAKPSFTLLVTTRDMVNTLTSTIQVNLLLNDTNDAPVAKPLQIYRAIEECSLVSSLCTVAINTEFGAPVVTDEDANDVITFGWNGTAPVGFDINTTTGMIYSTAVLTYDREISPIFLYNGKRTREIFELSVYGADKAGAKAYTKVILSIGVSPAADNGPAAESITVPVSPVLGAGLPTAGGGIFYINGRNFLLISNSIILVNLTAQSNDPNPNRIYPCNCTIDSDAQISCITPAGFGTNLEVLIYHGNFKKIMYTVSGDALFISYRSPRINAIYGKGETSFVAVNNVASRLAMPTYNNKNLQLAISVYDIYPSTNPSILQIQIGHPNSPSSSWLPVIPMLTSVDTSFASPSSSDLPTKLMVALPSGVGAGWRFRIRVGGAWSSWTPDAPYFTASFETPNLSSVYILSAATGLPVLADKGMTTTFTDSGYTPVMRNMLNVSTLGGETLYINGSGFGPASFIPNVYFVNPSHYITWDNNNATVLLNFSTKVCWKPDNTAPDRLLACRIAPGTGINLRTIVWVGNQVYDATKVTDDIGLLLGYSYEAPTLMSVRGPGAQKADTQGYGAMTVYGMNCGPSNSTNYGTIGVGALTFNPISLWYGPVTGREYYARECKVTTPVASGGTCIITCLSSPGISKGMTYYLTVGGQDTLSRRFPENGYAPPLILSITRSSVDTTADPLIAGSTAPMTVREYSTDGGERIIVSGLNFGPDPLAPDFSATYIAPMVYPNNYNDSSKVSGFVTFSTNNCSFIRPHTQIMCYTVAGAGTTAALQLLIGGQFSVLTSASFATPIINNVSIISAATGTIVSSASSNGNDILVIRGKHFGPPGMISTHTDGTLRGTGYIQSITYGATGTELTPLDYYIPEIAFKTHDLIYAKLRPGTGENLRVILTVSEEDSTSADDAIFSYTVPTITAIVPSHGPTDPKPEEPYVVTIYGREFGLLSSKSVVEILLGNPIDGTLGAPITPYKVYPDRADPIQVSNFLALPLENRTERLTFLLPKGIGAERLVRVRITFGDDDVNNIPVISSSDDNALTFSYEPPSIRSIVAETFEHFNDDGSTSFLYNLAVSAFGGAAADSLRLVILGSSFSSFGADNVLRLLEASPMFTFQSITDAENFPNDPSWNTDDLYLVSWAPNRIVALCRLPEAYLRVRHIARTFNGTTIQSRSSVFLFNRNSPTVYALQGASALPHGTEGGDIISFTVGGLLSTSTWLNVTVGKLPCAIVYGLNDPQGAYGTVVPVQDVVQNIIYNPIYFSPGTQPSTDSIWRLQCKLPPGQGTDVPLFVTRDNIPSGEGVTISYLPPTLSSFDVFKPETNQWVSTNINPNGITTMYVPTAGTRVRLHGSNFGICPRVMIGNSIPVYLQGDGGSLCPTALTDKDSTATHSFAEFAVPEGEGISFSFVLAADDQRTDITSGQIVEYSHIDPSISSITTGIRTAGGRVTVRGNNFGITTPYVYVANQPCMNVLRINHTYLECDTAVGSGTNHDVAIKVSNNPIVTVPSIFSYGRPIINSLAIEMKDYDGNMTYYQFNQNDNITVGITPGGYIVRLYGDNFGTFNYSKHCVFVSWRGRESNNFVCDALETFVGEGEIPLLAIEGYTNAMINLTNVNDANATLISWSHTHIAFIFPPGTGIRDIIVLVAGQYQLNPTRWMYAGPVLTSLPIPNHGPTDGGTQVVLRGYNFGKAPLDTSTALLRAALVNHPVATTLDDYLNRATVPLGATSIVIWKGCTSNYLDFHGIVPPHLTSLACAPGIVSHNDTTIIFKSNPGIGVNRSMKIIVTDIEPIPNSNGVAVTTLSTTSVLYHFDPPKVTQTVPRPVLIDDGIGYGEGAAPIDSLITVTGINFGSLAIAAAQGWTKEEKEVTLYIHGVLAPSAERLLRRDRDIIEVRLPYGLPVGTSNLTYFVAGQPGFTNETEAAAIVTACMPGPVIDWKSASSDASVIGDQYGGYFGRPGESCARCPQGAVCAGYQVKLKKGEPSEEIHNYPIPVAGWYNLNSTDALTSGMYESCPDEIKGHYPGRDVCVVACEPPEACIGANYCAEQYISKAPMFRCSVCAPRFYKRGNECIKCPDSPWALVIGFTLLILIGGGLAYTANKMRVNLTFVSIGVDYFQILAIFALSKVSWPPIILELFHILSAFNLNIEIVAPECLVPNLAYKNKWLFIMALPLAIAAMFTIFTLFSTCYKKLFLTKKVDMANQAAALASSIFSLLFIMYIYLTRNVLDVFNCSPTDPPDGKKIFNGSI